MKTYNFKEKPIEIHGAPLLDKTGEMGRLPENILAELPRLENLASRTAGGRVCFKTNSKTIKFKCELKKLTVDIGMSIFSCQSLHVLIGDRKNPRFGGLVNPANYEQTVFEGSINKKNTDLEDIIVYLPRNEAVLSLEIGIDDNAVIEAPTPYDFKPILYYGSSITEGGCCCNPFNTYPAVISNHLNVDFYNFGFSGNALAELCLAEYFAGFDMSIFVFDYDNNSPNEEHFKNTHEAFFKRFRELKPETPVVMMSMPREIYEDWNFVRKEIIKQTYDNAVKNGDKNVYFIDGETFFGDVDRYRCMIDGTHPNDIGFARMAEVIEPVIKEILFKD